MNPAYSSIALAVFCVLSLFLYPCFLPSHSYADEPLPINPSLTIGSSGQLAFSIDPGSFNHGSQSISVATSNYTGYNLTIAPTSGDSTALVNSVTNSTIPSIAVNTTESAFSTTSYGFTTDSTITSSTEYRPVTSGTIIKSTNASGTDNFNLTIGAKATQGTPAGTYTKAFTLTATANPTVFSVTYNANAGSDTVTNMPASPQTTGYVSGASLILAEEVPERANYTFLGWSTNSSASAASYQPEGTYTLDLTTSNVVTLYAIWESNYRTLTVNYGSQVTAVKIDGTTIANGGTVSLLKNTDHTITATYSTGYYLDTWTVTGASVADVSELTTTLSMGATNATLSITAKKIYLQEITPAQCQELGTNASITAYDSRDQNDYTIRFLDNQCWMTQNLRITGTISAEGSNFTSPSTFNVSQYTFYRDGRRQCETSSAYYTICSQTGNDANGNPTAWYNYVAATAGTITGKSNTTEAQYDICPSGWALPSWTDVDSLVTALNSDWTPFNPVYSGRYENNSLSNASTMGGWWTSTPYTGTSYEETTRMYLRIMSGSLTVNAYYRYSGQSIRCVRTVTNPKLTVTYSSNVQSVTIDGQTVANGAIITLEKGVNYTFTATTSSGYGVQSWVLNGNNVASSANSYTTSFTKDSALTINAAPIHTLTVNSSGATVSIDGTTIANGGTVSLVEGSNHSITATLNTDYTFNGWSTTTGGTFTSTTLTSTTFTMGSSDGTLVASTIPPRVITVKYGTGVSSVSVNDTTINNNGTISLKHNTSYTIKMVTSTGYGINSWSATSGTIANSALYTTKYTPTSNATLTASAKSISPLQSWNGCSSLSVGQSIELYDTRDGQPYRVTKYKMSSDGSQTACWMSNLNLGARSLIVSQLNSSNSNMPTASAISASAFMAWNRTTSGNATSYDTPKYDTDSNDVFDSYGNQYGTAYNYAALSAVTITASQGLNRDDATNSLCPYGWRIPTGGQEGEHAKLVTAYGGLADEMSSSTTPTASEMSLILRRDLGFSYAGYFTSISRSDFGSEGLYWNSKCSWGDNNNGTTHDSMGMLQIKSSKVSPTNGWNRNYGLTVRCVKS